jgi:hypothetical protein
MVSPDLELLRLEQVLRLARDRLALVIRMFPTSPFSEPLKVSVQKQALFRTPRAAATSRAAWGRPSS